MKSAFHESTPLTNDDCVLVFVRKNKVFDFPVHFHIDYELNFITQAHGAQRIVGDHKSIISDYELVLVGPNVVHGWTAPEHTKLENVTEITIQFPRDLFSNSLIHKNAFNSIKELLNHASKGITFSTETIQKVTPLLYKISTHKGIETFILLLEILHELSECKNTAILASKQYTYDDIHNYNINKIYEYVEQHFKNKITLEEIASHVNMTVISFSRLIKNRTGKTFVEFLNDYRIQYAIRLLMESSKTVSEITDECGFNNQANFNRIFKLKTGYTPTDYKKVVAQISNVN
ncbi:MAG TPA: AraC family transcriptional regulator [Bacteroidales bacterium]|jgi:AraC-like DNA-binding protein|nr:AraC family transcriptional regulator [Bacteroidales bacterium]